MRDEDASAVSGRKKIYGLLPQQGRMVIAFLSERGGVWKESQIWNNLRDMWGSNLFGYARARARWRAHARATTKNSGCRYRRWREGTKMQSGGVGSVCN